uniref:Uncharacterized protein n=1 Tax=Magallana gigas TaxID=29159 RepID=K1R327_MAGGI
MCDGKGGVTRYVVVQCTFFFSYFVTIDWSDIMDYSHRDGITFTCCYNHYYNGSSCVRCLAGFYGTDCFKNCDNGFYGNSGRPEIPMRGYENSSTDHSSEISYRGYENSSTDHVPASSNSPSTAEVQRYPTEDMKVFHPHSRVSCFYRFEYSDTCICNLFCYKYMSIELI